MMQFHQQWLASRPHRTHARSYGTVFTCPSLTCIRNFEFLKVQDKGRPLFQKYKIGAYNIGTFYNTAKTVTQLLLHFFGFRLKCLLVIKWK